MKLFKKLFSLFKRKNQVEEEFLLRRKPKKPLGIQKELEELQNKLKDFLLTRKVSQGLVVKKNQYSLTKTGTHLYKLEGQDKSGKEYSVLISTGNFLSQKEGKISGLIQVREGELNRVIQREYSSLENLLSGFTNLSLDDKSLEVLGIDRPKFNWKEILFWEVIWKEQILRRLRPNYLAVLLVSLDSSFQKLFWDHATAKQKKIISDELFYLNQGVNSVDSNPNTKNYDLTSIDEAFRELQNVIESIKEKREREA